MDKIKQMQLLVAEVGVFFANCDGVYDAREQGFIEQFIAEMEGNNQLTEEVKHIILKEAKTIETIETIIQMTKDLLEGFNEIERMEIVNVLSQFIEALIKVDGETHPNEIENYNLWKSQVE